MTSFLWKRSVSANQNILPGNLQMALSSWFNLEAGTNSKVSKRGITELADMVIVNKADGALAALADLSRQPISKCASLFLPPSPGMGTKNQLPVLPRKEHGIDECIGHYSFISGYSAQEYLPTEERKHQESFWLNWSFGITANQLLMNHPVSRESSGKPLALWIPIRFGFQNGL